MKKIFFLLVLSGVFIMPAMAREDDDTAQHKQAADTLKPYQKYPKLPAFNIRLMDSTTVFNTYNIPAGKKTMIVFFSPDCKHCQALVRHLTRSMDSFENVQFYMVTPVHSMADLRNFYHKYHLGDYKNIKVVGRDYEFFFGTFYGIKVVPDLALYDEHKMLIKLFEGDTPLADIYKYTR
jgi:thiol-disulfide isomerase/thioredoxin